MSKTTKKETTNNSIFNLSLKDYKIKLQECDNETVNETEKALNTKNFHIELRDTTSCIMFVRDANNHTVFNVYDNFRIQFTKVNADKYEKELLKDNRFYTHIYKHERFISAKAKDVKDFINLCEYCYKCIAQYEKETVKATEKTTKAQKKEVAKQA